MIKAIVLDFDGVIIDSEKIWLKTKIQTLNKHKINLQNNLNSFLGVNSKIFFKKFIPKNEYKFIIKKVNKTYKDLTKKNFSKLPKLCTGIVDVLELKNLIKCIVSNNSKKFILQILKKHKIRKYFKKSLIIGLKGTKNTKPSPNGFLKVLKKTKLKPDEVIVIEDSLPGLSAAKRAKIKKVLMYNYNKKGSSFKNIKKLNEIKNFLN